MKFCCTQPLVNNPERDDAFSVIDHKRSSLIDICEVVLFRDTPDHNVMELVG